MRKKRVIIDLYFKRGKYLLYLINKRVKSGERREDVIKDIYVFCPSLESEKIAINTIGLNPDRVIKYTNVFNDDLDGYIKWLKKMIEIDKLGLNRVISDGCELFCIQNPPYDKTLHIDFFNVGLDLICKFNGKIVIIEPATWLINVRKNGKSVEKYDCIKSRINGHIESIVIENLNKEFGVTQSMPFSITSVDMSKKFDTIDYKCCGDNKVVKSIYDCNLVGCYDIIWNIFEKVKSFSNMMKYHMTNEDMGRKYWYAKCVGIDKDSLISGSGAALCGATNERVGMTYDSDALWSITDNGNYLIPYTSIGFHYYKNEISNEPLHSYDRGKKITDKIAWNVFGTKNEIENWKHFIFFNKLSLFLNICLTDNQHNNSVNFLPWLVDKKYTDDEINKLFGFTDDEIKLIDITIKKYEKNSPWFKRYMCGKSGATDVEVDEYIKKITEEC